MKLSVHTITINETMVKDCGYDKIRNYLIESKVLYCYVPRKFLKIFETPIESIQRIYISEYRTVFIENNTLVVDDHWFYSDHIVSVINTLSWILHLKVLVDIGKIGKICEPMRSGLYSIDIIYDKSLMLWIKAQAKSLRELSVSSKIPETVVFSKLHTIRFKTNNYLINSFECVPCVRNIYIKDKKITRAYPTTYEHCLKNRNAYEVKKLLWLSMYHAKIPKDVRKMIFRIINNGGS